MREEMSGAEKAGRISVGLQLAQWAGMIQPSWFFLQIKDDQAVKLPLTKW